MILIFIITIAICIGWLMGYIEEKDSESEDYYLTLTCDKCGKRFVGFDLIPDGENMICPVCFLNKS